MKCYVVSLFVLLASTSITWGQDVSGQFENEGLWEWFVKPVAVDVKDGAVLEEGAGERTLPVALCEREGAKLTPQLLNIGGTFPLLICGTDGNSELRLVALDEDGQRLEFLGGASCYITGASLQMKNVSLGDKKLRYLGVEHLTPERQKRHATKAQEKLLKEGVTLSYPTEGVAFPYSFSSPNGKTINSEQHRGQVVLIQLWASW